MSLERARRSDLCSILSFVRSRPVPDSDSDSSSSADLLDEATADAIIREHIDQVPVELRMSVRNLCMRRDPYMQIDCEDGESIPEYLFDSPESIDNIQYSPEAEIIGISFYKLIEMTTGSMSGELMNVFLSTYPLYATEEEVLFALAERLRIPEPMLASASEKRFFHQHVRNVLSHKLASIMKAWARLRPELFQPDSEFVEKVKNSLPAVEESRTLSTSSIASLPTQGVRSGPRDRLVFSESRIPLTPFLPQELDFRGSMLLSWDITEIARQCTLLDWTYLSRIEISECLGRKWEKEGKEKNAPNITAMSRRFAAARALFIRDVVYAEKDNRVKLVKRLLDVAQACMTTFFNFETPFIISTVLKSDAIMELKKTMAQVVTKAHKDTQKKLSSLYSDFALVRQEMQRQCNVPCWLALRQELAIIDIRNPQDFTSTGLINLQKHKHTAEVIARLKQYQTSPMPFFKVGMLYDYLEAKSDTLDEVPATRMARETD